MSADPYETREYDIDNLTYLSFVQRLYQRKISDIDELREQLTATWYNVEQSIIDSAIDQWRKWLTACVKAKGGHF